MEDIIVTQQEMEALRGPLTAADRVECLKVGFCMALSEENILPSEAEAILEKLGRQAKLGLVAEGVKAVREAVGMGGDVAKTTVELGNKGLAGIIGGGALAGYLTGRMHYGLGKKVEGQDDPESNVLRKKLQGYKQLGQEIEAQKRDQQEALLEKPTA
jgi:hypothetical protein